MTSDELRKLADELCIEASHNKDAAFIRDAADALDALTAENERLKRENSVQEMFLDEKREALAALAEFDGNDDCWAELKKQRDEARSRVAELERLLRGARHAQSILTDPMGGDEDEDVQLLKAIDSALEASR